MAPCEWIVGGCALRGIRAGEGGPRGLVVALHGGGYDANYWHAAEGDPGSLIALGASFGFDMVAIDRPGYRGSAMVDRAGLPLGDQADLLFELIERIAIGRAVFLIGHSMGGILSLIMAGDARGGRLRGLDVSGVPLRFVPAVQIGVAATLAALRSPNPPAPPPIEQREAARRALFYGADGTFDPALVRGTGDHPTPLDELQDAHDAPAMLPPIMARIAIPVQWTIAEQESSSVGGAAMLEEIGGLFHASPHVRTAIQAASGHNISLHHVARAYHLRALAFFEECRALARGGKQ